MASAKANPLQGFGRGIFGLKNFDALRKPRGRGLGRGNGDNSPSGLESRPAPCSQASVPRSENTSRAVASQFKESPNVTEKCSSAPVNPKGRSPPEVPKKGAQLKAGYSYSANPNSPLGHELSFNQNDALKFIEVHATNPEWWVAETANGTLGYVPAKYMVSCELSALPWLQGREEEVIEEQARGNNVFGQPEKGIVKPYRATYDHDGLQPAPAATTTSQWHCEVCDKDFNGPKPYQAHMASKMHKEELAYREGQK